MYSQGQEGRNCRICMEENAEQDWDDCLQDHDILTYKDCYYKYTQLDPFDEDNFTLSTLICRSCSDNLTNINTFVSKAIEIHNLLQESIALKYEHEDEDIKTNFETILIPESDIKSDLQLLSNDYSDGNFVMSETETNNPEEQPKENEMQCIESLSNESQTNPTSKKNSSKPWEIPTCCTICSKVLYSKYKAIEHEKTHLENRERKETCKECGMKFYNKSALYAHMGTHVKNRERTKKCEFCDKAFYHKGALNVHRRIHLGQMIKCTLCIKEFYRQVDLDKHMLSHSTTKINGEVKPKKIYIVCCEICGDNVRSVYYKSHVARHNNEPLAKCAICDKEFYSRRSCNSHLKAVHRKGSGERSNFIIAYETVHYSNLFLQQKAAKLFTKEKTN